VNLNGCSNPLIVLVAGATLAVSAGCSATTPERVNLDATLWVQTAPEYDAVARSVYVAALHDLPALVADSTATAAIEQQPPFAALPAAVILDVDETVLDNSPYQARLLIDGDSYDSESWAAWVDERAAAAVPGALEFSKGAVDLGVTLVYVTNRRATQEQATRDNLAALGFPLRADVDVILTRGERPDWESAKSSRRRTVAGSYRIVMLVGDDLGDFVDVEGLTRAQRDELAQRYRAYWGRRWRMLPNPTYGSWERTLFGSDFALDAAARADRKAQHLEPKGDGNE